MERAAGRPVLSMVDRVVEEVRRRNWKRVGVLTLGRSTVYTQRLDRLGIGYVTLGEAQQKQLDKVIFGVMEGCEDESAQRVAHAALAAVRNAGVDGVILGCTELPFLIRPSGAEADLINPIQILAEAAVEFAIQ
jgi:aspartate racemase